MKLTEMRPGLRVHTVEEIDLYPDCILAIGTTGYVKDYDPWKGNPFAVVVRLDEAHTTPAITEWDNEILVYDEDDESANVVSSAFELRPA